MDGVINASRSMDNLGPLTRSVADAEIVMDKLVAVHANDSKVELGAGIDRHENIGDGHIGTDGFKCIMAEPSFKNVPFFLEVPGFDGEGPDKKNLDLLKEIRKTL